MAIVPTAGWLLVVELSNLAMYASGRLILGAYRSPAAVGLYEGPVRAHNLLYALGGALAVPVVPDGLALRRHRRRAPPARAGRARHALHARAVRAGLRDPDRAGRADPRRLARRSLRATAAPRWRSSSPTGSSTAGWSSRRGSSSAPGGRASWRGSWSWRRWPTWCCRSCSRPSWGSRARRSARRSRSSSRSRSCCGWAWTRRRAAAPDPGARRTSRRYALGAALAARARGGAHRARPRHR